MRIVTKDNKIISLEELYKGKEASHREQAGLALEEKIRILVSLQNLARTWGGKKDVRVWDIKTA